MREEPTRSLLLLDTDVDERRLISAIASRAGWSVVGASDHEGAMAVLHGPHGRDIRAALMGSWDAEHGPELIATLREKREKLPVIVLSHGDTVSVAVEAAGLPGDGLEDVLLLRAAHLTRTRPAPLGEEI